MHAEKIVTWPGPKMQIIDYGTVRGGDEAQYMVQGTSEIFSATVAFSCLVKPQTDDKVMYVRDPYGGCYILAILERPTGLDAVMSFPGDLMIESAKGNVTIATASGINISTASTIDMHASGVDISALKGQINIREVHAVGSSFVGTMNRVHLLSDTVDMVAKRLTQHLKNSFRWVEQIEQVTAGQMINKVQKLFSVRARQSSITAIEDVKIDGERVHLG